VLLRQGDKAGAQAAFRKDLEITTLLAAHDPGDSDTQRDFIASLLKMNQVTGDKAYAAKALEVALALQQGGVASSNDVRMIENLRRLVAQ